MCIIRSLLRKPRRENPGKNDSNLKTTHKNRKISHFSWPFGGLDPIKTFVDGLIRRLIDNSNLGTAIQFFPPYQLKALMRYSRKCSWRVGVFSKFRARAVSVKVSFGRGTNQMNQLSSDTIFISVSLQVSSRFTNVRDGRTITGVTQRTP